MIMLLTIIIIQIKKTNKKWSDNNLEKIQFYAPKGYNDKISIRAKELNLSKASYLKTLIDKDLGNITTKEQET